MAIDVECCVPFGYHLIGERVEAGDMKLCDEQFVIVVRQSGEVCPVPCYGDSIYYREK